MFTLNMINLLVASMFTPTDMNRGVNVYQKTKNDKTLPEQHCYVQPIYQFIIYSSQIMYTCLCVF